MITLTKECKCVGKTKPLSESLLSQLELKDHSVTKLLKKNKVRLKQTVSMKEQLKKYDDAASEADRLTTYRSMFRMKTMRNELCPAHIKRNRSYGMKEERYMRRNIVGSTSDYRHSLSTERDKEKSLRN